MMKRLALISCCFLLTACGFHLRGKEYALPHELSRIHLTTHQPYDGLNRELKRQLALAGVTLVEDSRPGVVDLTILNRIIDKQRLSTSANAFVHESLHRYTIVFSLKNHEGTRLLGPSRVSSETLVVTNTNTLLSSANEANTQREELAKSAVTLLIYRLRSPATLQALQSGIPAAVAKAPTTPAAHHETQA